MKLLISCTNSPIPLIGYDFENNNIFWKLETNGKIFLTAGITYQDNDLILGYSNSFIRIISNGYKKHDLPGPYYSLTHSIHAINNNEIGITDTGNSCIRIFNKADKDIKILNPINHWTNIPHDALHLNDFTITPFGIIASCFDYRPWRGQKNNETWDDWCKGNYGILINASGHNNKSKGRIVGCGFNHPHSLNYINPYLYLCSSSTGTFHICKFNNQGTISDNEHNIITHDHFLRGAYKFNNIWFLGGSTIRHGEQLSKYVEIYSFNESTKEIQKKQLNLDGEVYDILPWSEHILTPILKNNIFSYLINHFGQNIL